MDYTILYILIGILAIVGLTILSRYLTAKKIVSHDDLSFAMTMLGLTSQIVSELRLKDEKKIKTITSIILFTMDYVKDSMEYVDKGKALKYALDLCSRFDIEVTTERELLISQLLDISLSRIE